MALTSTGYQVNKQPIAQSFYVNFKKVFSGR